MTTLLRRSLLMVVFTLLVALSGEALAQTRATSAPPDKAMKKVARKKTARKAARRRTARKAVRRGAPKRRMVTPQLTTQVVPPVAAVEAQPSATAVAPPTVVVEQAQYTFAGYAAAEDGAAVRIWHSREYTVRSPYAYLGRMPFGGEWRHVWAETSGTPLASAVTETGAETMPDIARMMERFPDGGQGVVVAGWDEFAPPVEPSVEVVEFGNVQPGATR